MKPMRTLILYGSLRKTRTSGAVPFGNKRQGKGKGYEPLGHYFVRAAVTNCDLARALDLARPKPGETVLNTVPMP